MSRPAKYVGWGLLVVVLLVAGRRALTWQRHAAYQRALALSDPLTLLSRSRQLMQQGDTLDPAARQALFRRYDMAGLWQLAKEQPVQNGFVGAHHERLEVVFQQVRPDVRQPGFFRVRGLMRLRHRISALHGTIQLRQVRRLGEWQQEAEGPATIYTAMGSFRLRQDKSGGGTLRGSVALDLKTTAAGQVHRYYDEGAARASRGFAFEGTYRHGSRRQSVLWAAELIQLGEAVLGDFNIGGRALTINPKYARYGWGEYYQNDEWWLAKPTKRL